MDKYQIVEITEQLNHAGTKATADICVIADSLGFKKVNIKMATTVDSFLGKIQRQIGYYRDWKDAEKVITSNSILLLQHPFHHKQLTRDKTLQRIKNKGVKVISVVHDIEELRAFRYNDYYKNEYRVMLDLADVIIVHNDIMRQWLVNQGYNNKKLISLNIFDYLQESENKKEIEYERSITIAGNLDTNKCGYIKQLSELNDVKVNLYGPNFDDELSASDNIAYHGSFPVNEIPKKLDRGFGLVWDGDSIDGCLGLSGQYLRYNNPHKLSLYLSSGIPVVIWENAAEATFVKKNGLGITVKSLRELGDKFDEITDDDYLHMINNVDLISKKLQTGFYAKQAISNALSIIENNVE